MQVTFFRTCNRPDFHAYSRKIGIARPYLYTAKVSTTDEHLQPTFSLINITISSGQPTAWEYQNTGLGTFEGDSHYNWVSLCFLQKQAHRVDCTYTHVAHNAPLTARTCKITHNKRRFRYSIHLATTQAVFWNHVYHHTSRSISCNAKLYVVSYMTSSILPSCQSTR